jgi:cell wall assembly regulator SMI1
MSVRESWERIASWYDRNTRPGKFWRAPGASESQIDALEEALGSRLPEDVRESYRLHNGTSWLLHYGEVMALGDVEAVWRRYGGWQRDDGYAVGASWQPREIKGPIKPIWWSPLRIPITDNGGGDPVMLDLDPAEGGTRGQVIDFNHEVGPLGVLASGWAEWLGAIADGLDAGEYVFHESEETVAPPRFYG